MVFVATWLSITLSAVCCTRLVFSYALRCSEAPTSFIVSAADSSRQEELNKTSATLIVTRVFITFLVLYSTRIYYNKCDGVTASNISHIVGYVIFNSVTLLSWGNAVLFLVIRQRGTNCNSIFRNTSTCAMLLSIKVRWIITTEE